MQRILLARRSKHTLLSGKGIETDYLSICMKGVLLVVSFQVAVSKN